MTKLRRELLVVVASRGTYKQIFFSQISENMKPTNIPMKSQNVKEKDGKISNYESETLQRWEPPKLSGNIEFKMREL